MYDNFPPSVEVFFFSHLSSVGIRVRWIAGRPRQHAPLLDEVGIVSVVFQLEQLRDRTRVGPGLRLHIDDSHDVVSTGHHSGDSSQWPFPSFQIVVLNQHKFPFLKIRLLVTPARAFHQRREVLFQPARPERRLRRLDLSPFLPTCEICLTGVSNREPVPVSPQQNVIRREGVEIVDAIRDMCQWPRIDDVLHLGQPRCKLRIRQHMILYQSVQNFLR